MRKSHNEQGYALLIVLFLVLFVMVVSAVFIRGTLGNAKQEIKVDESHLTVMAAEAGVDFFKTYISNFYLSIVPDLEIFIQKNIENQLKDPKNQAKVIDYNIIRKNTTTELERMFNEEILGFTVEKNIELYNFVVETTSVKGYPDRHKVIIKGISLGMKNGNEEKISFEQTVIIPDFSGSPNSNGGGGASSPNMHKLYPDNVKASYCGNNKKLSKVTCKGDKNGGYSSVANSTIYFPDGFKGPNGNFNVSNSTLYSKGNLNVDNFNNLIAADLNIDGSFNAENMNNITNSLLAINGSVGIKSNVQNMVNSRMVIRGSAHVNGHLTIEDNSMVCVAGSLQIDKKLTIGKGSKLVHWGSLVAFGGENIAGEIIQVNSENEVWEQCKLVNSNSIEWTNPIMENVIYE